MFAMYKNCINKDVFAYDNVSDIQVVTFVWLESWLLVSSIWFTKYMKLLWIEFKMMKLKKKISICNCNEM